jgi:hypothetical protein
LKEDVLWPWRLNFALKYATGKTQANQEGLKLNGTQQLLACADDVNILCGSTHTKKKSTEALVTASKETGLEVNAEKTKYVIMSRDQNARQYQNIKTGNKALARVKHFRYLGTTLTNQNAILEAMKSRWKSGTACYHFVQNCISSVCYPKI